MCFQTAQASARLPVHHNSTDVPNRPLQRVQKTPYNPADWPGAKAWPATMCLISFFSLAVFFQALTAALN